MDIFESIKEIEKIYENLINNAKKFNLKEIEEFRNEQNENFDFFIGKINVLVNTAIGNLTIDVEEKKITFEKQLRDAIKNIEAGFQKNIKNLHNLIIKEIGIDF
ncbi:MAG: hypothetical protein ACFE9T_14965 [Promethearchaeota archaeon]